MHKIQQSEQRIPLRDLADSSEDLWTHTRDGEPRGYIDAQGLKELWIHTGTACNLACPFCLEGSSPGDKRLLPMLLSDVQSYLDEALTLGVEQFSFTGGEPFVIRDFVNILEYASRLRPCFVLTNGTAPLLQRTHQLAGLRESAHPIRFRISLDYPDASRHDAGRGKGSFEEALQGIRWLTENGFDVSIARQMEANENSAAVENKFRLLLQGAGIRENVAFTAFPDFGTPGAQGSGPEITETCMNRYPTEADRAHFMCAYSRMLVKRNEQVGVVSCTLVDDDPEYDMGSSLAASLDTRVMLKHHRCMSCYRDGASCSAP
ncbi:radical SAM protein [Allohahella sp. A8]|uniref:radical SAM protein n=1 Tax=Allohahella sp. A8 TaxID=3141461 RepID=UPI003A80F0BD